MGKGERGVGRHARGDRLGGGCRFAYFPYGGCRFAYFPYGRCLFTHFPYSGVATLIVRLIGVYSAPKHAFHYPNGDRVQLLGILFECEVLGGRLEPGAVARFTRPRSLR